MSYFRTSYDRAIRTPQYKNFSYDDVHPSPTSFDKFGPIPQKYGPLPASKEGKIELTMTFTNMFTQFRENVIF